MGEDQQRYQRHQKGLCRNGPQTSGLHLGIDLMLKFRHYQPAHLLNGHRFVDKRRKPLWVRPEFAEDVAGEERVRLQRIYFEINGGAELVAEREV